MISSKLATIVGWFLLINQSIMTHTSCTTNTMYASAFVLPTSRNNKSNKAIRSSYDYSQNHPRTTTTNLHVVADAPIEKEGEEISKRRRSNNDDDSDDANHDDDDWIPSPRGGFIPIFRKSQRKQQQQPPHRPPATTTASPPTKESITSSSSSLSLAKNNKTTIKNKHNNNIVKVVDIHQYKKHVVDEQNMIVCVRFYMESCRSCKATEGRFRRLASLPNDNNNRLVKFVEVPVTKDNAYLHQGLSIPSFPYSHIYHPDVGLVEELKINKKVFKEFEQTLKTYIDGECYVKYDDDIGTGNSHDTTNTKTATADASSGSGSSDI